MSVRQGKYAKVIEKLKLPRIFGTDASYQDKVNVIKQALEAEPDFVKRATVLAAKFTKLRDERDALKEQLYEVNLRLEALTQLMAAQFEEEQLVSLRTTSGRLVSVFFEPYASIEDAMVFRQWCDADPDLRNKMQLPWQTLNQLAKERVLAGEPELPGVKLYAKTQVRLGSEPSSE